MKQVRLALRWLCSIFPSRHVEYSQQFSIVGYISEVGSGVSSLDVGQYVIIPDNAGTGHIDMGVGTGPRQGMSFGGANGGLQGTQLGFLSIHTQISKAFH